LVQVSASLIFSTSILFFYFLFFVLLFLIQICYFVLQVWTSYLFAGFRVWNYFSNMSRAQC
jgi:hypothetical protein